MISLSVNAHGRYRYGLPLTDDRELGMCVLLGGKSEELPPTWLVVSHSYSRRRFRHDRIYECDIESRDRCTLVEPYSPNEIALIRFNTHAGRPQGRNGYTQKYWGSPQKVERALTVEEDTRHQWEDAVYVMSPGDTVFIHSADPAVSPYLMRWNGDSLERIRIGVFNEYVVRPWLSNASSGDIRIALSNAKRRRHHALTKVLSRAV